MPHPCIWRRGITPLQHSSYQRPQRSEPLILGVSTFRGTRSQDRAIQVKFSFAAKAEHFVHCPSSPNPPSILTERGGQLRAKGLYPVEHCTCCGIDVPLG